MRQILRYNAGLSHFKPFVATSEEEMYDLCLNKLIDYIILQCQKEKNGDKGELIN